MFVRRGNLLSCHDEMDPLDNGDTVAGDNGGELYDLTAFGSA